MSSMVAAGLVEDSRGLLMSMNQLLTLILEKTGDKQVDNSDK